MIMKKVKLSSVSMKTTPLDIEGNRKKIIDALKSKEMENSSLILFPELCITGYGCEDAFYNSHLWKEAYQSLIKILPYTSNRIVIVGLPLYVSPFLYNVAAVLCNESILGFLPKKNLANTGIHYEKRWFQEGSEFDDIIRFEKENVPFGNYIFQFADFSLGIEICEDAWVMSRPSHGHTVNGADIIVSPGASHFALGKHEIRRQIFRESSRNQNNIFLYSNLNGNEAGKVIFDGGCMAFQNGRQLAEGNRLFYSDIDIMNVVVDLNVNQHNKSRNFRKTPQDNDFSVKIVYSDYTCIEVHEPLTSPSSFKHESKTEIFSKAVSLGLFDYMIKSHTKGYTISLSGGADSAASAVLVYIMKKLAKEELGEDIFQKLNIDESKLLCTIFQGTINNSKETRDGAKLLANELGSIHYEIDIDSQIDTIVNSMKSITKIDFNWKDHDVVLQNVQARVRSPIVWFLTNANNHLLICTANRSEGSVGYTTMDGDSSGSLSPLAGISKEFLLEWLHSLNEKKLFTPHLEGIDLILSKKPSAELKPLDEKQEDEKDLMPYPLLQKIEYEYIVNGRSPKEIFEVLRNTEKQISEFELLKFIEKYNTLFKRSQWKRERLPPAFHLDEYGLDPRSSYRFPILSK